jgi:streptogramin lyase
MSTKILSSFSVLLLLALAPCCNSDLRTGWNATGDGSAGGEARASADTGGSATHVAYPLPTPKALPMWIVSGPDDNLWFTEDSGNQIGRITTAGVIKEFPVPTPDSHPYGIAVGPDGNLWFTEQMGNKIGRITPSGSITEIAIPEGATAPQGIVRGPDNNLWFAIGVRLARLTLDGVFTFFPPVGESVPVSGALGEIANGPDGNIWFTEMYGNAVGRMTLDGSYKQFHLQGESSIPRGITAGPDGNLWFTEEMTDSIGRITPDGDLVEFAIGKNGMPTGIALGPDGNLWFAGPGIGHITPDGVVTMSAIKSSGPIGITAGPDGGIWFTDVLANSIGHIAL